MDDYADFLAGRLESKFVMNDNEIVFYIKRFLTCIQTYLINANAYNNRIIGPKITKLFPVENSSHLFTKILILCNIENEELAMFLPLIKDALEDIDKLIMLKGSQEMNFKEECSPVLIIESYKYILIKLRKFLYENDMLLYKKFCTEYNINLLSKICHNILCDLNDGPRIKCDIIINCDYDETLKMFDGDKDKMAICLEKILQNKLHDPNLKLNSIINSLE